MGAINQDYNFAQGDSLWAICRKILQRLAGAGGGVSASVTVSGGAVSSSLSSPATTSIAVTGTRVQLPAAAATRGVIVTCASTNAASIYVGGSNVTNGGANQGMELGQLGTTGLLPVSDASLIWINGTAGDKVGVIVI